MMFPLLGEEQVAVSQISENTSILRAWNSVRELMRQGRVRGLVVHIDGLSGPHSIFCGSFEDDPSAALSAALEASRDAHNPIRAPHLSIV
jgi:hypothetical protein